MKDPRDAPVVSTRSGDVEIEEAIDRFVVELAERIDRLQDAQLSSDYETLEKLSVELRRNAKLLGFPTLADLADAVERASRAQDSDAVLDHVVSLTELARRIRSGHQGAF